MKTRLFVLYTIRQWMALALCFGAGAFSTTSEVPTNIGCVMAVLFAVGALLVMPPFDFIWRMQNPEDL